MPDDIQEVRRELHDHIKECHEVRLDYERRLMEGAAQFREIIQRLDALHDETRGVLGVYQQVDSAAKLGRSIRAIGAWLLKHGIIGGIIYNAAIGAYRSWEQFREQLPSWLQ